MIGTTLKRILDERALNVSELAREIQVSPQTLYSIIRRDNNKINFDLLLRICNALDVPLDVFRERGGAPQQLVTVEERRLLRELRELDAHGHEVISAVLQVELLRVRGTARPAEGEQRLIPLYATPAAAGYASPALGDDYDDYAVPVDSPADFAVRIAGDSMEPYIRDASIVLVKRGETISDGDVGLFFVDGDMKCKQYCRDFQGNVYLFSLNRARRDADIQIPASSGITICCFGKVLLPRKIPLPVD